MATDYRRLMEVDPLIHAPARLMIIAILVAVESADFLYLLRETGLTKGNLATHVNKLEDGGYLSVEKTFRGKTPLTIYHLTDAGRQALADYRRQLQYIVENTAGDVTE